MRVKIRGNYFLMLSLCICFWGCSKSNTSTQEIDYALLEELPFELEMEIGESENFIPNRLNDLLIDSESNLIISDQGSTRLDQFDASGTHIGTIAKEGGGPGELAEFFLITPLNPDTFLVKQQSEQIITFAKDTDGLFRMIKTITPEHKNRKFSISGNFKDDQYFATEVLVIQDVSRYMQNLDDYRSTLVAIIDESGSVIQDSLLFLKTPYPHLSSVNNGFSINSVPYRVNDRLIPLSNGAYLVAESDSNNIKFYNNTLTVDKVIPLNVKARPLSSEDLDFAVKDINENVRNEIKSRISDFKPSFLNIWASKNNLFLYTDKTQFGKEIVVLNFDGEFLGKFNLPLEDEIKQIKNLSVYTIHKSEVRGDFVRKYRILL